jgi:hypothetical protein
MINKLIAMLFVTLFINTSLCALDKDNIREITIGTYHSDNQDNIGSDNENHYGSYAEFEVFKRVYINKYINISGELGAYYYGQVFATTTHHHKSDEHMLTLNELLLNISPIKDLTYSIGQIPAQDGAGTSIRSNELKKSDFLYTIIDNSGQGQFIRYKLQDSKYNFRISIGEIESDRYPLDNDIRFSDKLKGTNGIYYLMGFKLDKFEFILNRAEMDLRFKGIDALDVNVNALGITYDDSDESGIMLYTILGQSKTTNNQIMIDTPFGKMPYTGTFGEKGTSKLFGIKYKFSYIKNEYYVGAEYLNQSKYWSGLAYGDPYSPSGNGDLGVIKTIYAGMDYSSKLNILVQYQKKHLDTYINMQTLSQDDIDKDIDIFKIQLKYLF